MKQAIIMVSPEGEITIEAVGFKGKACEQATKALEEALGSSKSKKKKPEYFQTSTGTQSIGGAN